MAVWIASGRWYFAIGHGHWYASVEVGVLHFTVQQGHQLLPVRAVSFGSTVAHRAPARWYWSFKSEELRGGVWTGFTLQVPLWAPWCVLAAGSAAAWSVEVLARRRARGGLCPDCRYDRAGLPGGAVCPECGGAAAR
jgi:hypothetical protein